MEPQPYQVPDMVLHVSEERGHEKSVFSGRFKGQQHVTFDDVSKLFGATFKPIVKGDKMLVNYNGIKFVFNYDFMVEDIQSSQMLK